MKYSKSHLHFQGLHTHLYRYFIPCHREYAYWISSGVRSQRTMGKLGLIPPNIQMAFLFSDWLYFLWHGINVCILNVMYIFQTTLLLQKHAHMINTVICRSHGAVTVWYILWPESSIWSFFISICFTR